MSQNIYFWIGGKYPVESAINNKSRIKGKLITCNKELFQKYKKRYDKVELVSSKKINSLFKRSNFAHQDIALEIKKIQQKNIQDEQNLKGNIIVLDGLDNILNIGNIVRTSYCLNIKKIIIKKKITNINNPYIYKTAAGTMENVKIYEEVNLSRAIDFLKKKNYFVTGFDSNSLKLLNKKNISILDNELNAFVFGSEHRGISKNILDKCDEVLKININKNIDSLNVASAVTAAISIFNFYYNNLTD